MPDVTIKEASKNINIKLKPDEDCKKVKFY